ncbi:helix-turn-helix domain-containing protein [Streptomyces hainanensis]|uniref:XRE family transcriptional regulator n=1 Tax=Streptomyces hainanensis TaxID=402648 RepID=A0A4R4SAI9_9ACTN|nr:helix-turn-helix transcriptional regulator [Streptomyces hainanensis]TDC60041.1 XRE family transcriptional regulator [Streptomyces hainanensis]
MGRPELPVDQAVPRLAALAAFLREQRRLAGATYRELAARARVSEATLKRAASGRTLPRRAVVTEYLTACTAENWRHRTRVLRQGERLWRRARRAVHTPPGAMAVPRPHFVRDAGDLSGALRDLHVAAGRPSLRTMERRAGAFGALPHSTAHRIVRGETVPRTEQQLLAYLRACEVPVPKQAAWLAAWHKARDTQPGNPYQTRALKRLFAA